MFRKSSLSRYCIVETGKGKQSWAAVDRPSARGEFAHCGCSSVSSETSCHGGARCSIDSKMNFPFPSIVITSRKMASICKWTHV